MKIRIPKYLGTGDDAPKGRVTIVFAFLVLCMFLVPAHGFAEKLPQTGWVVRVLDGDTVVLRSGVHVRYLGIDTPEIAHDENPAECYGIEAEKLNRELVENRPIRLEYDKVHHDPHGRLLAYVYNDSNQCINLLLVEKGYAFVYRDPRAVSMLPQLLAAQRHAIDAKLGIWDACHVEPAPYYLGNRGSFVFHRPGCPFARQMSQWNRIHFANRWDALREGFRPCRRCRP